jgi:hypothetical protein
LLKRRFAAFFDRSRRLLQQQGTKASAESERFLDRWGVFCAMYKPEVFFW